MSSILIIALIGFLKSIQDLQAHGKLGLTGAWFTTQSWKLKWKGGDPANGERFFGSSTMFVFVTDAWHFFGMLRNVSVVLAIIFYGHDQYQVHPVLVFCILYFTHNIVFTIFYYSLPKIVKYFKV